LASTWKYAGIVAVNDDDVDGSWPAGISLSPTSARAAGSRTWRAVECPIEPNAWFTAVPGAHESPATADGDAALAGDGATPAAMTAAVATTAEKSST
jgi:hypothetical protein